MNASYKGYSSSIDFQFGVQITVQTVNVLPLEWSKWGLKVDSLSF